MDSTQGGPAAAIPSSKSACAAGSVTDSRTGTRRGWIWQDEPEGPSRIRFVSTRRSEGNSGLPPAAREEGDGSRLYPPQASGIRTVESERALALPPSPVSEVQVISIAGGGSSAAESPCRSVKWTATACTPGAAGSTSGGAGNLSHDTLGP